MKRRDALKLGVLGAAALTLPTSGLLSAHADSGPAVTPFSVPLTIPPVLRPTSTDSTTDYYSLAMSPAVAEILPGYRTPVLSFGGSFPGPTIRARRGRRAVVTYTNRLSAPAVVHLHGGHVPAASDGFPTDVLQPGQSRTVCYPNQQPGATLWYHDHTHHMESEQIYRGLAGLYLLSDPAELTLPLPTGAYDVPLMIRDARFGPDGSLVYQYDDFAGRTTMLVNGRPQPNLTVRQRRYRFRLVNASNMGFYTFQLSNGASMTQIGADGGLLRKAAARPTLMLWPGERADVLLDFSAYPVGTKIVLENLTPMADPMKQVMQFEVVAQSSPNSDASDSPAGPLPDVLGAADALGTGTTTRRFVLSTDVANVQFLLNGRTFDPDRVDATVKHGTTEIWEVSNTDTQLGIPHSMHLHATHFRVLDRNGVAEPDYDAYPKDTVRIPAGDTVRIKVRFDMSPGRYPFHCHFLDHNSNMQMGIVEVTA